MTDLVHTNHCRFVGFWWLVAMTSPARSRLSAPPTSAWSVLTASLSATGLVLTAFSSPTRNLLDEIFLSSQAHQHPCFFRSMCGTRSHHIDVAGLIALCRSFLPSEANRRYISAILTADRLGHPFRGAEAMLIHDSCTS